MVLQSQASWGTIERLERGRRIVRKAPVDLGGSQVAAWLAEACLRYAGQPLSVVGLHSNPIIFLFALGGSTASLLSKSPSREIRSDSTGNHVFEFAS